ncbi:MAG: SDR family NAD(P)-dependent oxidoreductase [Spirochaetes bacterium]|nr:SDR family NAD(P)-dependent oxidoreductase [Spirochaetota bacterium]
MSKVWLITGSSRGLGRALVIAALKNGDKVIATARKPEALEDLKKEYGENIFPYTLDVTDAKSNITAVEEGIKKFGRIDNVVCNAGYGNMASVEDTTMEDFRAQFDVLLFGVVHTVKAALPYLRKQKSGHILIVSSVGGRMGTPGLSAYQSAKWAVEGFGEVLNAETAPVGIKVTILEPSGMRTDWAGSSMTTIKPEHPEYAHIAGIIDMVRGISGNETGDTDKIARAIVKITQSEEVPLRLLFGKDAVEYANAIDKKRLEETKKWAHISNSIEWDG